MELENKCTECGGDAVRYCRTCALHFCGGCACVHLPLLLEEMVNELTFGEGGETDGDRPYEGYESSSGQSWLSNAVIVGTIPDAKLKSALQYHRNMCAVIQEELSLRRIEGRPHGGIHSDLGIGDGPGYLDKRYNKARSKPRTKRVPGASVVVEEAVKVLGKDFVLNFLKERLKK